MRIHFCCSVRNYFVISVFHSGKLRPTALTYQQFSFLDECLNLLKRISLLSLLIYISEWNLKEKLNRWGLVWISPLPRIFETVVWFGRYWQVSWNRTRNRVSSFSKTSEDQNRLVSKICEFLQHSFWKKITDHHSLGEKRRNARICRLYYQKRNKIMIADSYQWPTHMPSYFTSSIHRGLTVKTTSTYSSLTKGFFFILARACFATQVLEWSQGINATTTTFNQ